MRKLLQLRDAHITLARDAGHVQHLVLIRLPTVTWCGQQVKAWRRRHVAVAKLPRGICPVCLAKWKELMDA